MNIVNIRNHRVQIDIESEIREYKFDNERWTADKLIASSPFRNDQAPSFFVNLDGEYAGTWGDSGALDEEYSSGNFIKLIALLNEMTYEDSEDYLIEKYGVLHENKPGKIVRINHPKISSNRPPIKTINNPVTAAYSPYLVRRGISRQAQERYGIGYNERYRGYTAFPLRAATGEVANVFYRRSSFKDKRFFYEKGATPKNRLLFGAHIADEVSVLCEGIIDALSWETLGYSALAVGGARISREQVEIIKRSPIRRLYLAGDNDAQGRLLNDSAKEMLRGYVELYEIDYKKEKDANDALLRQGIQFMHDIFDDATRINSLDRPILHRA